MQITRPHRPSANTGNVDDERSAGRRSHLSVLLYLSVELIDQPSRGSRLTTYQANGLCVTLRHFLHVRTGTTHGQILNLLLVLVSMTLAGCPGVVWATAII